MGAVIQSWTRRGSSPLLGPWFETTSRSRRPCWQTRGPTCSGFRADLSTRRAEAQHGEVVWAEHEAEAVLGAACHCVEEIRWSLEGGTAALADQVAMGLRRQVIGSWTVPQVGVHHHPQAFELFQVPVDGRGVD